MSETVPAEEWNIAHDERIPLIERIAKQADEIARLNMVVDRLTRTNEAKREHRDKLLQTTAKQAAEIDRLRAALRDIAEVGYVRAKDAPIVHDEAIHIARAALGEKP